MSLKPTDEAIIAAVRRFGGGPTYAIKNGLRMAGYDVETPWVLRRMKRLERDGLVTRVPTSYAVMITWKASTRDAALSSCATCHGRRTVVAIADTAQPKRTVPCPTCVGLPISLLATRTPEADAGEGR